MNGTDETGLTCNDCGKEITVEDMFENPGKNVCPHCGAGGGKI